MNKLRKSITIFIMLVSLFLSASLPTYADNFYTTSRVNSTISKWMSKGIFTVSNKGTISLNQPMTRAEFAASLCRIFKFSEVNETLILSDVPNTAWYYSSVQKVLSKGLMTYDSSSSNYLFRPHSPITCGEAVNSLQKAYHLTSSTLFVSQNLDLNTTLTRAKFIMLIDKATTDFITKPCVYTHNINGNLVINISDVTLKGITISGNLYLTEGIGKGCITLDNVSVKGTVYVNGCGENSLLLKNKSFINSMIVENKLCTVRLSSEKSDYIKNLVLRTPTILDGSIVLSDFESTKYAIFSPVSHFSSSVAANSSVSSNSQSSSNSNIPAPSLPSSNDSSPTSPPTIPNIPLPPTDTPSTPSTENPSPTDPLPPSPPNSGTDIPTYPDTNNTTPSVISLTTPSNVYADFTDYPHVTIGWDSVPLATDYDINILNLETLECLYSLQTTASAITLNNSAPIFIPGNKYSVAITARSNSQLPASVIKKLSIPQFRLSEANNGTLRLYKTEDSLSDVCIRNLRLGIYKSVTSLNEVPTAPLLHTIDFSTASFPYIVPVTLENDTAYSLRPLSTFDDKNTASALSTYTASYFANLSYKEALASQSKVGKSIGVPITLTSTRHLRNLSSFVANGNRTKNFYFKLLNDIDFYNPLDGTLTETTNNFVPIGIKKISYRSIEFGTNKGIQNLSFDGDFDGGNCKISNLRIYIESSITPTSGDEICAGLFGLTTGNIQNITLDSSCQITAKAPQSIAAGIVAYGYYFNSSKSISNCFNYASINSTGYAAGIAGHLYTNNKSNSSITLANCSNYGNIISASGLTGASGIVNSLFLNNISQAVITNCYNFGNIESQHQSGGIVSHSYGSDSTVTIKHCYNLGAVSVKREYQGSLELTSAGILGIGDNHVNIFYCINGAPIASSGGFAQTSSSSPRTVTLETAGIAGYLNSTHNNLSYNFNYGTVIGTLLDIEPGRPSPGKAYSGAITSANIGPAYFDHCYTLFGIGISSVGVSNASKGFEALSYTEFIEALKNSFSTLPSSIEETIPKIVN